MSPPSKQPPTLAPPPLVALANSSPSTSSRGRISRSKTSCPSAKLRWPQPSSRHKAAKRPKSAQERATVTTRRRLERVRSRGKRAVEFSWFPVDKRCWVKLISGGDALLGSVGFRWKPPALAGGSWTSVQRKKAPKNLGL